MRIKKIILESLILPFKRRKSFLVVIVLAMLCEIITHYFYSLKLGNWSILLMIFNSVITILILGLMINITDHAVFEEKIKLNFLEHLVQGLKDYIITAYYMFLTFIISSFLIIPTGAYSQLTKLHQYILTNNLNVAIITVSELSHQLPVSLKLDLAHFLQLNLLLSIIIFITLISFAFIGKILLIKTDNMLYAFDIRVIFKIIKNIGIIRYLKFLFIILLIVVILFNVLILLEDYASGIFISALMEASILFILTNAFYQFIENK